jgi:hypothetical protein
MNPDIKRDIADAQQQLERIGNAVFESADDELIAVFMKMLGEVESLVWCSQWTYYGRHPRYPDCGGIGEFRREPCGRNCMCVSQKPAE